MDQADHEKRFRNTKWFLENQKRKEYVVRRTGINLGNLSEKVGEYSS